MKTYADIYSMMCYAALEYVNNARCDTNIFCSTCKKYNYCGIDSINIAKLMIYKY